jgi:hypothetical protein
MSDRFRSASLSGKGRERDRTSLSNVSFSGQLETAYLPCTNQNPG